MLLIFNSRVCIIFNSLNQIHIIKFSSAVLKIPKKKLVVYAKKRKNKQNFINHVIMWFLYFNKKTLFAANCG